MTRPRAAALSLLVFLAPALLGLGLPVAGCILGAVFLLLVGREDSLDGPSQKRPMAVLLLVGMALAGAVLALSWRMPNIQFQAALAGLAAFCLHSLTRALAAEARPRPWRDVVFTISWERALLLVFAAALLYRLAWVMQSPMTYLYLDETKTLLQPYQMLRTGNLLPTESVYKGGMNYYPVLILFALVEGLLRITRFSIDFLPPQKWLFFAVGRTYFALLATAAIPLLYTLGKECRSRRTGLIAALIVAFSQQHVAFSYFPKEDHVVLLMSLLVALATNRWLRGGKPASIYWAGAFAGLAAASKLTGGMTIVIPLLALALRPRETGQQAAPARLKLAVRSCLIAAGAFLALNPVYYLDTTFVAESYRYALEFMTVSLFGVHARIGEHPTATQYFATFLSNLRTTSPFFGYNPILSHAVLFTGLAVSLRRTRIVPIIAVFTVFTCLAMLVYNYPGYRFFLSNVFLNVLIFAVGIDWIIEKATLGRLGHLPGLLLALFLVGSFIYRNVGQIESRYDGMNARSAIARDVNSRIPPGSKVLSNRFMAFHVNPNRYEVEAIWMLGHTMSGDFPAITREVLDEFDFVTIGAREYQEEDNPRIAAYDFVEESYGKVADYQVTNVADKNLHYFVYRSPRAEAPVSHYMPAGAADGLADGADFPLGGHMLSCHIMYLDSFQPGAPDNVVRIFFDPKLPDPRTPRYWPARYALPWFTFVTRENSLDYYYNVYPSAGAAVSLPVNIVRARPMLRFDLSIDNAVAADGLDLVIDGESAEGVILGRSIVRLHDPKTPPIRSHEIDLARFTSRSCLMPGAVAFVKLRFLAPRHTPITVRDHYCSIINPVLARAE